MRPRPPKRRRNQEDATQGDEGIDTMDRSDVQGGSGSADVERELPEPQPVGSGPGGVERERGGQREGER